PTTPNPKPQPPITNPQTPNPLTPTRGHAQRDGDVQRDGRGEPLGAWAAPALTPRDVRRDRRGEPLGERAAPALPPRRPAPAGCCGQLLHQHVIAV
ncbi:hypothetical protein T484DRAFT_1882349, partial [Baffinella frigidus]